MKITEKIRWGTERRLEFIEFRIYWEGGIRRGDITETFGVSVPQASADLSLYQQVAPSNLVYDASAKMYVATKQFQPKFLVISAEKYLTYLRDYVGEQLRLADSWMSYVPAADAMPIPTRRVKPEILKQLVAAVRKNCSVEIIYQSMNKEGSKQMWRRISPHAFAYDGLRWHLRAYCHKASIFKDFVLSRCDGVRDEGESGRLPQDDDMWNERVDMVVQANPKLNERQRATIEQDYQMIDGTLTIPVRRALLFYFEKYLRLDYPDDGLHPEAKPLCMVGASNSINFPAR